MASIATSNDNQHRLHYTSNVITTTRGQHRCKSVHLNFANDPPLTVWRAENFRRFDYYLSFAQLEKIYKFVPKYENK